jgi:trimethylamine--corrinoid protein Co-methyltransferase
MLDFLLVFSLPKLVFDDEMCAQALRFVREVRSEDDLPVDA